MRWSKIKFSGYRYRIDFMGRAYYLDKFEESYNWVLYKGEQHLVVGWYFKNDVTVGLIRHPDSEEYGRIVLRTEVELL